MGLYPLYKSHHIMGLCVGKAGNAGVLDPVGPVREGKESVKALVRYKAGQVGLQNLGNTCFLNSAVQCLSHTQPLTEYFLENDWKSEVNADNPLGMGGRIAEGYGALIDRMWRGTKTTVNPEEFKGVVEQWAPQFQGYEQHDSSELLTFLLDGLHEDLNRVTVKKYVQDAEEGDGHGLFTQTLCYGIGKKQAAMGDKPYATSNDLLEFVQIRVHEKSNNRMQPCGEKMLHDHFDTPCNGQFIMFHEETINNLKADYEQENEARISTGKSRGVGAQKVLHELPSAAYDSVQDFVNSSISNSLPPLPKNAQPLNGPLE